MKIEMTKCELAAYLVKSENLLKMLYKILAADSTMIQESPTLSVDNLDDSCANVIDAADELRCVAEAALAILETLDFIQAVLENAIDHDPMLQKLENANV